MTEPERRDAIKKLKLPPEVARLTQPAEVPEAFRSYLAFPDSFYAQGWPEAPGNWPTFENREIVPLWQHGEKIYAADLSENPACYISFYLEFPEQYSTLGKSVWLPLLEVIDLHVWEYGGGPAEIAEAREFARRIGFPHLSKLEELFAQHPDLQEGDLLTLRQLLDKN